MSQRPSTITDSTSPAWPWCTKHETARGDGGIDRDGGAGGAQRGFLLCGHAAAVGGDQARGQQAAARDVLDRRDAALLANGRDLAPDLSQMERGERVELVLELAHAPEQFR